MRTLLPLSLALLPTLGVRAEVYSGVVRDSASHEPIENTGIIARHNGVYLGQTTTDTGGRYEVEAAYDTIQLTFFKVGYRRKTISAVSGNWAGVVQLAPTGAEMDEVVVVGSTAMHYVDKDVYHITNSVREGMTSAGELLGTLPNITYDWLDKSIKVYGRREVRLTVDGVEKPEDYIKGINPKRIREVDVMYNPSGRHAGEDYVAVIDIKLYEDYVGWDMTTEENARLKMDNLAHWNALMLENPSVNCTYTRNGLSLNAGYSYNHSRMAAEETQYEAFAGRLEKWYGNDGDNMRRKSNSHNLFAGADYKVAKGHTISGQVSYTNTGSGLDMASAMWYKTPREEGAGESMRLQSKSRNNDVVAALFYNGKAGDKWTLYADLNYNYYNARSYMLNREEGLFATEARNKGDKNYVRVNADATYAITEASSLKFGYNTTWKDYRARELLSGGWDESSDNYRNRVFAYYSLKATQSLSFSAGAAAEWIKFRTDYGTSRHFAALPDARLMYGPSSKFNATLQYYGSVDYPTLSQTAITFRSDTLFMTKANPALSQAVTHNLMLRIRLFECLTLTPSAKLSGNAMETLYAQEDDGMVSYTTVNSDYRQYSLNAYFEKLLWMRLLVSASVQYDHNKVRYQEHRSTSDVWTGGLTLMYMDRKKGWRYMLQYRNGSGRTPALQGYRRFGESLWLVGLMKTLCRNRLSLMLSYTLPLKLGIDETSENHVETSFYRRSGITRSYDLIKNMLMLRVSFRLDHGKRTQKRSNEFTTDKED